MIKLRGNIWWSDLTINGKRVRQSLGTADRAEAMRKLATLMETHGGSKESGGMTVGEALDTVWQERWSDMRDSNKAWLVDAVKSTYGDTKPLASVTRETLKEYQATLQAQGKAPATINRYTVCLTGAMRYMRDEKQMPLVLPKVPRLKEPKGRPDYLTTDQINALLAAEKDERFRLFWRFLLATGARLSDGLQTGWSTFDWEHGLWMCPNTKVEDPIALPLPTDLIEDLKAYQRTGPRKPFPWSKTGAIAHFRKTRKAAGLSSGITCHVLRHTCATQLLANGADIREVQVWLGHQNITTTMRYAKVMPSRLMKLRDLRA